MNLKVDEPKILTGVLSTIDTICKILIICSVFYKYTGKYEIYINNILLVYTIYLCSLIILYVLSVFVSFFDYNEATTNSFEKAFCVMWSIIHILIYQKIEWLIRFIISIIAIISCICLGKWFIAILIFLANMYYFFIANAVENFMIKYDSRINKLGLINKVNKEKFKLKKQKNNEVNHI